MRLRIMNPKNNYLFGCFMGRGTYSSYEMKGDEMKGDEMKRDSMKGDSMKGDSMISYSMKGDWMGYDMTSNYNIILLSSTGINEYESYHRAI
jgi:pentapeptide MXKDX repeat protein